MQAYIFRAYKFINKKQIVSAGNHVAGIMSNDQLWLNHLLQESLGKLKIVFFFTYLQQHLNNIRAYQ